MTEALVKADKCGSHIIEIDLRLQEEMEDWLTLRFSGLEKSWKKRVASYSKSILFTDVKLLHII